MLNNDLSSFRDPSGFIYTKNGHLFRQVNKSYQPNYDLLLVSGLYKKLTDSSQLITHHEVKTVPPDENCYKTLEPLTIPFISYPYEWCFGQLKDAALLTLNIQKTALGYSMSLKDATSFNIQFLNGRPIFIDTLSFEALDSTKPWVAYKQFCEQFLAPLALMSQTDIRLSQLLLPGLGSIPLDLAAKLLPKTTFLNPNLLIHLHLHAKSQQKYAATSLKTSSQKTFNQNSHLALVDSLHSAVESLHLPKSKTTWSNYYNETNYSSHAFAAKTKIVDDFLKITKAKILWDVGANNGFFSQIAAKRGVFTISMDIDPLAVEQNYQQIKAHKQANLLPLVIDLTNPSPAIGWQNSERDSLLNRPHPDTVMALALVHHLAIANNLPLPMIARLFASLCQNLIIEFIPKEDSQVKVLLQSREDIFPDYTQTGFENAFANYFNIKKRQPIPSIKRTLYLLTKK